MNVRYVTAAKCQTGSIPVHVRHMSAMASQITGNMTILYNRFFRQTTKKPSTLRITSSFPMRKFIDHRWIPLTNGQ